MKVHRDEVQSREEHRPVLIDISGSACVENGCRGSIPHPGRHDYPWGKAVAEHPETDLPQECARDGHGTTSECFRHTVLVSVNNYPDAIVLDAAHQEVYSARDPLLDRALFELHGPGPRLPMKLRPRRVLVGSYFVVLRGPLLQADAVVGPRGKEHAIQGPTLPLTLTDEAPPAVTVMATPTLHATITPPGVSSPPYFVEQTQCAGNGLVSTGRGWQAAASNDLTPEFPSDCISPHAWVAVVG
jgi:hypothetical protein